MTTKNNDGLKWIVLLIGFGMLLAAVSASGQVNIYGKKVDASQGFTYQSGAVNGSVLIGDGVSFKPGTLPSANSYNFTSRFSVTGSAPSFTVDLAGTGTAGTYSYPKSITTNAYGLVTSVTPGDNFSSGTFLNPTSITVTPQGLVSSVVQGSSVSRTCSSGVCYKIANDGTVEVWGSASASFSSSTLGFGSVSFPSGATFTTTPTITGLVITQAPNGSNDSIVAVVTSKSTSGFNFYLRCATNIGGSGCSNLNGSVSVDYSARGY